MSDFYSQLTASKLDFAKIVWPHIRIWFGDASLVPVEDNRQYPDDLDTLAGIDVLVRRKDGIQTMATRVQWETKRCYRTFTIRVARTSGEDTEFQKRLHEIMDDSLIYPFLTCQAYLSRRGGHLLRAGMAETKPMYLRINENIPYFETHPLYNPSDSTKFYPVRWKWLRDKDVRVWEWPARYINLGLHLTGVHGDAP